LSAVVAAMMSGVSAKKAAVAVASSRNVTLVTAEIASHASSSERVESRSTKTGM